MQKSVTIIACVLIVLAVSYGLTTYRGKRYLESFVNYSLLDPNTVRVIQGSQMPIAFVPSDSKYTSNKALPTVDGTNNKKTPRSMAMMTFNKCKPECCPSSYSCSGGCVCITKEQSNYISSRGNNKTIGQCQK